MAAGNRFNCFTEDVCAKKHNLQSDTLRLFLTNVAPIATQTVIGNITEADYTHCSTRAITTTSCVQTLGVTKLILADLTLTATGGTVGPFRYVGIYNDTSATDALICWYDRGSSLTLADTETFTTDFSQVAGVFTMG